MTKLQQTPEEKAREKYHTQVNKRVEKIQHQVSIKEQYGVFTRGMQEDLFRKVLSEYLTPILEKQKAEIKEEITSIRQGVVHIQEQQEKGAERLAIIENKLKTISQQIDWIYGQYQKHDEEHILLNNKVSQHSDQIETIENQLHIAN